MLTKINPDGTWSVNGIDFRDCPENIYGALCKLRDYETTGLEPNDFRSDSYEKKYLYKVFYRRPDDREISCLYCQTDRKTKEIAAILKWTGCDDVAVNKYPWQAFIEE